MSDAPQSEPSPPPPPPLQPAPPPFVRDSQHMIASAATEAADPALQMLIPINVGAWAIAAGYIGLFSVVLLPAGPFAIFAGIMALRRVRAHPGERGRVRAWIGIGLGSIGTLLLAGVVAILISKR